MFGAAWASALPRSYILHMSCGRTWVVDMVQPQAGTNGSMVCPLTVPFSLNGTYDPTACSFVQEDFYLQDPKTHNFGSTVSQVCGHLSVCKSAGAQFNILPVHRLTYKR